MTPKAWGVYILLNSGGSSEPALMSRTNFFFQWKKVTQRLLRLFLDLWLALAWSGRCPAVPAWPGEHWQGCQLSSTAARDSQFWVSRDALTLCLTLRVLVSASSDVAGVILKGGGGDAHNNVGCLTARGNKVAALCKVVSILSWTECPSLWEYCDLQMAENQFNCFVFFLFFALWFKEFSLRIDSIKKYWYDLEIWRWDSMLVVWKCCFCFGNCVEKVWYWRRRILCPIWQSMRICMCPYFHRFRCVLLCSAVCHVATMEVIVGILLYRYID